MWEKRAENGQKWTEIGKNSPKMSKTLAKWAENGQKWAKTVQK